MTSFNLQRTGSQYSLGFLLEIVAVSEVIFYFQNFQKEEPFFFENSEYIYVPFTFKPPTKNINLDQENTSVILPNIPLIVSFLETNDYFRDAEVISKEIQYDFPTIPAIGSDLMIVNDYTIIDQESSYISLNLENPFNIINGKIPNAYFSTGYGASAINVLGYIPEVPLYSRLDLI